MRFGAFRRRYALLAAKTASPPGLGAQNIGVPLRRRGLSGVASRLRGMQHVVAGSFVRIGHAGFDVLYKHRRIVRKYVSFGSGLCYSIEQSSGARLMVNMAGGGRGSRLPLVPRALFAVIRVFLVSAVVVHLAAGQTQRMVSSGRIINLLFRDDVVRRRRSVCLAYFQALMRGNLPSRVASEVKNEEWLDDYSLNHIFGAMALYSGQPALARYYFGRAIAIRPRSYLDHRLIGRSFATEGRIDEAKVHFQASVDIAPNTVMAHQNLAGRYDVANYRPKPWELANAGELLVYDTLGQHAEDLYSRGRFEECLSAYRRLLDYQAEISRNQTLPESCRERIAAECPTFRPDLPVRILPYEWVTQFGHFGLVEAYLKRAAIGEIAPANYVLLAPPHKVSNQSMLSCFDDKLCVVRDVALVDDLFPYQRYFGEGFIMARTGSDGSVEPFARAAARAQVEWARQSLPPLLKLPPSDLVNGRMVLSSCAGLNDVWPEDAWYVGLHVREGGFYGEANGGMSEHRNARIEDYYGAIEEITSRGGWVVRLGDRSMRPLPRMDRVIDYALSPGKSERMDLFILATSRFVIGTTSGLTSAAQAFGIQMLLVNCISPDWQFWGDGVDFVPKRVWSRHDGRYLSIGETYRQPLQGMLISHLLLQRRGYDTHANSSEEIRAAVQCKLDVLDGLRPRLSDAHPLMRRYRQEIAHDPYLFGAARPIESFLEVEAEAGRLAVEQPSAVAIVSQGRADREDVA